MDNIMGAMTKIVTIASTAISAPIAYLHKKSGVLQETSDTFAVVEPLENYKVSGEIILLGKKFIISKDDEGKFLKLASKMNDVITHSGETWYVATTFPSDVDLVVICSQKAFSLTTKKVTF